MNSKQHGFMLSAALAGAVILNTQTQAKALEPGDPAPALKQGRYIKGEPVKDFEPGKVYVLEFWATWCGPCVKVIPHMSELQAEYGDKVVFIGQSIWERETEQTVVEFVEKMGDRMNYRVALDDTSAEPKGYMANQYMTAAGMGMIPIAFIIDQGGKVAWIGHPGGVDGPLSKVVVGRYDPKAEKAIAARNGILFMTLQTKIKPLMERGENAQAAEELEKLLEEDSGLVGMLTQQLYQLYVKEGKIDTAYAVLEKNIPRMINLPQLLNWFALDVATASYFDGNRRLDVAKKAALLAVEESKREDAVCLETLAKIVFMQHDTELAIQLQKEAIAVAEDSELKKTLAATLAEYMAR